MPAVVQASRTNPHRCVREPRNHYTVVMMKAEMFVEDLPQKNFQFQLNVQTVLGMNPPIMAPFTCTLKYFTLKFKLTAKLNAFLKVMFHLISKTLR